MSPLLLVACGPGDDPALGPCETRKPASVVVGTGESEFQVVGDSVEVQIGPAGQGVGSFHIWFALRCKNLGPYVTAELSVEDVATGQVLTPVPLKEAAALTYNKDQEADEVFGIRAFLPSPNAFGDPPPSDGGAPPLDPSMLTGRQVKMRATVDDHCKGHAESEVTATVSRYHQL